jgi:hypothetical protein
VHRYVTRRFNKINLSIALIHLLSEELLAASFRREKRKQGIEIRDGFGRVNLQNIVIICEALWVSRFVYGKRSETCPLMR